jgi:3-oxoacyl-[acyl-carrier-protein] synthase II
MVAIRYGVTGPNFCTVSACASSAHAIGEAYRTIQRGDADAMIAGGAEAAITPLAIAGFANMKALSSRNDDPGHASRPFDKTRDGFVLGDGAGIVVLESLEHATARGATILAEVAGFGMSADAYHMTQPAPEGRGAQQAMRAALADACVPLESVAYVNAHGTSTPPGDIAETQALKAVFGPAARKLVFGSTKSMTGHLLGAAGGLEFAICTLVIERGVIPPTINYVTPDPDCDLDCAPNRAVERRVDVAMSNSFGFGGHNVSLVAKRFAA